jgi:hypothetical protein
MALGFYDEPQAAIAGNEHGDSIETPEVFDDRPEALIEASADIDMPFRDAALEALEDEQLDDERKPAVWRLTAAEVKCLEHRGIDLAAIAGRPISVQ